MNGPDKAALAAHIAQERAARAAGWIAALVAIVWTIADGLPGLLAGLAAVALFRAARPGPSAELDKVTGREAD